MINRSLILIVLTLACLTTQPVSSDETIIVVSDSWENFVTEDGSGYYLDLLRLAYPSPQYEFKLSIMPYARTLYTIKEKKADIVLGVWSSEYESSLLSKYPVEVDLFDAVQRRGEIAVHDIASFDNSRVIARVGYSLDELLNSPLSYEEYTDLDSMIKMIQYNRADVLLGYTAELELAINLQELEDDLTIQRNVLAEYAYFGFCAKPRCLELKKIFDKTFIKLHKDGVIEDLLLRHDQPATAVPPLETISILSP